MSTSQSLLVYPVGLKVSPSSDRPHCLALIGTIICMEISIYQHFHLYCRFWFHQPHFSYFFMLNYPILNRYFWQRLSWSFYREHTRRKRVIWKFSWLFLPVSLFRQWWNECSTAFRFGPWGWRLYCFQFIPLRMLFVGWPCIFRFFAVLNMIFGF